MSAAPPLPLVLVLNGPNLNMLGVREPEIYGRQTIDDLKALCVQTCERLGLRLDFRQTNHEGKMIEWIQQARGYAAGIVINAAAWTHTSLAIHDALKLIDAPIVEVHLSDPRKREPFRHFSYIEPLAVATVAGHGAAGYAEAIQTLSTRLAA